MLLKRAHSSSNNVVRRSCQQETVAAWVITHIAGSAYIDTVLPETIHSCYCSPGSIAVSNAKTAVRPLTCSGTAYCFCVGTLTPSCICVARVSGLSASNAAAHDLFPRSARSIPEYLPRLRLFTIDSRFTSSILKK